jgi:lysophospholipase L1-like esterase
MPGSTVNILVLGDSAVWGQGLQPSEKFHSLVQAGIRAGNPAVTDTPKVVVAHSGATIGSGDFADPPPLTQLPPPGAPVGEVPTSYPTIIQQSQRFTGPPAPLAVDLILVDGGINDVSIFNILNPFVSTTTLETLIRNDCYTAMKVLLVELERKFPNARIIVTGYYPIVSAQSNLWPLELLCLAVIGAIYWPAILNGAIFAEFMKQNIVTNCQYFADRSSFWLNWAVFEERNASNRQIHFADPYWFGLNATRSVFTASPWLFGINADGSRQDTIDRQTTCAAAHVARPEVDVFACERASAGHPNQVGAQAYASAILNILFPPRSLSVHVSPSPVPLRVATSIVISAEDAATHAPVAGTVQIRNFDSLGRAVYAQVPTGTSYAATFRQGKVRQFDPETRTWYWELTEPGATVSATGYPSTEVDFGW